MTRYYSQIQRTSALSGKRTFRTDVRMTAFTACSGKFWVVAQFEFGGPFRPCP